MQALSIALVVLCAPNFPNALYTAMANVIKHSQRLPYIMSVVKSPYFSLMILLTLLYLCIISRTPTLAIPTNHPPFPGPPALSNFQSILIRENAPSNSRTIWSIIWSCFSTVFACAWIAVHPNIPAPEDSAWKILRRRMMIMAYVLLAPEMVIIWAARQHRDAKVLAEEFQIKGRPSWTKTHAFFLIMGGFTLHTKGRPLRVLEWKDLEALARAGRVDWPNITEEEIKDRSKGDYLSKGIVILQTTWFIIQIIARAASKLTITELEVVTLAFSTLIGVIYYLWWDKPLDVRCSVPVHLVEHTAGRGTADSVTDDNSSPKSRCLCRILPNDISPTVLEREEAAKADQAGTDHPVMPSPDFPSFPLHSHHASYFNPMPTTKKNPPLPLPLADSPRRPTSSISWIKRLHLLIENSCRKRGTLAGLVHVFVIIPTDFFFGAQFDAMMAECTLESDTQQSNDQPTDTFLRNGPLRVPTFYSYTGSFWDRLVFGICVSILFGAIHCVAWYDEFPSSPERWGWRISAIIVSVMPLLFLSLFTAGRMEVVKEHSAIFAIFRESFAWVYMTSRIALLVLPLIALRALPPGAYVDFDWATIIPHI